MPPACQQRLFATYQTSGCTVGGCGDVLPLAEGFCHADCAAFMTQVAAMTGQDMCPPCDEPNPTCIAEIEPNDTVETAMILTPPATGGMCLEGTVTCGNDGSEYTGDSDIFSITAAISMNVSVSLTWATSSDLDKVVYDAATGEAVLGYDDGPATSESGSFQAVAGATYYVFVGCWAGNPQSYLIEASW